MKGIQVSPIYAGPPCLRHCVHCPPPLDFFHQTLLPHLSHRLSPTGPDSACENQADGTNDGAYAHILIECIRVRPSDGQQLLNGEFLTMVLDRGQLPRVDDVYEMTA